MTATTTTTATHQLTNPTTNPPPHHQHRQSLMLLQSTTHRRTGAVLLLAAVRRQGLVAVGLAPHADGLLPRVRAACAGQQHRRHRQPKRPKRPLLAQRRRRFCSASCSAWQREDVLRVIAAPLRACVRHRGRSCWRRRWRHGLVRCDGPGLHVVVVVVVVVVVLVLAKMQLRADFRARDVRRAT
jgi:hypothetical protein